MARETERNDGITDDLTQYDILFKITLQCVTIRKMS